MMYIKFMHAGQNHELYLNAHRCLPRRQNKVFKVSGHHGQPIPKLVGHSLHLLGHATESRSLAISSLCLYNWSASGLY